MKKSLKHYILLFGVFAMVLFSCTGCSNERREVQLTYRQEGITALESGDYEKALESFQKALDQALGNIGDTELDICFYKAKTQYLSGDLDGAMATYDAIIDYNGNPEAYFLRGNLYYKSGQEEQALADYKKAVENEKEDYDLYIGIYKTLAARGKAKEGQSYLNTALEIKGNKAEDKIQKGRINFLLGENDTAIQLLNEAKEEDPQAYFYLAQIYSAAGDAAASEENLAAYMEEEENLDSYKLYELGSSLMMQGDYDMAVDCFMKALELKEVPNKQMIMKTLAVAYEKQMDLAAARDVMADYVAQYPEDEEAAREYTFLETR